jgi:hypothetical protein
VRDQAAAVSGLMVRPATAADAAIEEIRYGIDL